MNPIERYPNTRQVILRAVATQFRRYLSPYMLERVEFDRDWERNPLGDMVAVDVVADILTEQLPPEIVTVLARYTHPEAIGRTGVAVDARFATWFDHFTATYRGRWWGRLLRLHKRKLRYTFVEVPYVISAPVECEHFVRVDVANSWTYPHADTTIRDLGLGDPVLKTGIVTQARPSTRRSAEQWHR